MRLFILLLFSLFLLTNGAPDQKMCDAIYRYIARFHSDRATLVGWVTLNCEKMSPRPEGMTCQDIIKIASDCQYDGLISPSDAYGRYLAAVRPQTLHRYGYYTPQTVRDYGAFGNWYYPNRYPWHMITGLHSRSQLETENIFMRGGPLPYQRADNIVNVALQQTNLPMCLHDIIYCAGLEIARQNAAKYSAAYHARRAQQVQAVKEGRVESGGSDSKWWKIGTDDASTS